MPTSSSGPARSTRPPAGHPIRRTARSTTGYSSSACGTSRTTTPPERPRKTWPTGPVAQGAEVVDGDGVPGNYNLAGGDRPRIYGTQTAFWVMNDVGNVHANSATRPIGLEVRVHAFAITSADDAMNRITVYRYTLVNR